MWGNIAPEVDRLLKHFHGTWGHELPHAYKNFKAPVSAWSGTLSSESVSGKMARPSYRNPSSGLTLIYPLDISQCIVGLLDTSLIKRLSLSWSSSSISASGPRMLSQISSSVALCAAAGGVAVASLLRTDSCALQA